MRPIDADALISEIKKDTEKAIEQDDRVGSFWLGYIAGMVIKQPTIQPEVLACGNGELVVQPEPHEGEWVDGRCNKCGGQAPFWVMASTYYESDFCPHCGAKMKGEANE